MHGIRSDVGVGKSKWHECHTRPPLPRCCTSTVSRHHVAKLLAELRTNGDKRNFGIAAEFAIRATRAAIEPGGNQSFLQSFNGGTLIMQPQHAMVSRA